MSDSTYKKYFSIDKLVDKIKNYLPSLNEERFRQAYEFAEKAHRGQLRKDGSTPYISHPVAAVEILASLKADEDSLISAFLHDVPEDTEYTLRDVEKSFGQKVAYLVDGITKLSEVQYKHDMPTRQVESLKKLLLHSAKDLRVIIIKLADRLHNMSTLDNIDDSEKRLRIATETLEIYVPLANLLGIRELKSSLEDMCFKYIFPPEYEEVKKKLDDSRKKRHANFSDLIGIIKKEVEKSKIKVKIFEREKNLYSIYKSLCTFGKTISSIDDRIGVVITVDQISDCYNVLGIIHLKFAPITKKFKDYIANPKLNGYQGLHTAVFGVDGVLTEVQIRTNKMNTEAEYGIASNFISGSKNEGNFSTNVKDSPWLKNALKIGEQDNIAGSFLEDLKLDVLQDRMVVLTPKGRPVDLPEGASIIDFAYAIHTNLGNHAEKAEVNGVIVPITQSLKTRDIVKIITSKEVFPDLSWLPFVKTNQAKRKILSYQRKVSRGSKIDQGRQLLQTELDILHMGLARNINFKKAKKALLSSMQIQFDTIDDLFVTIGEGKLNPSVVIRELLGPSIKIGTNLKWISIKIVAKNRFRLMRDIYEVLYKYADDMSAFKGWASKHSTVAHFQTDIALRNDESISKIFHELKRVEGVVNVHKTSRRGWWLSTILGFLLASIWILHPMIIRIAVGTNFASDFQVLTHNLVYFGLILMFAAVLSYLKLVSKFFPLLLNKKRVWLTVFMLPVVATLMLALEIIYYELALSWPIILLEMLFVYIYIWFNYASYQKAKMKI